MITELSLKLAHDLQRVVMETKIFSVRTMTKWISMVGRVKVIVKFTRGNHTATDLKYVIKCQLKIEQERKRNKRYIKTFGM